MLGFTDWLESLKPLGEVARIHSGLGLVTVFLVYLKRAVERRYWRNFKESVHDWVDRMIRSQRRHPKQLGVDEWKAECERMLFDANFTPLEVERLLDVAIVVAKGIASDRVLM